MAPELTQELVASLRSWYEDHDVRQKVLAATLGVSPQGLNEILAGRSRPNSETALRTLEFLRTTMNNDAEPKTLFLAKERIAELTSELRALRSAPAPAATTAPRATAAAKPATNGRRLSTSTPEPQTRLAQLQAQAASMDRGTGLRFNDPPATPKMTVDQAPPVGPGITGNFHRNPVTKAKVLYRFPDGDNAPYLIGERIKTLPTDLLAEAVANADNSAIARNISYLALKERRALGDQQ